MKNILILSFTVLFACVLENKEQSTNQKHTQKLPFLDSAMLTKSSFFEIMSSKDTHLVSEKGTRISIPASAFVNNQEQIVEGVIKIELKEILTLPEMIFNNLPTVSNGKPLSSGGVIYINAQQNGESLSIATHKSLYIEIPTKEKVAGMNVYKGSQDEKGEINWEYSKDLYKGLIPLPSEILDWYAASEAVVCVDFLTKIDKSKYENTFIATREFEERAKYINGFARKRNECIIGKQVFSIYCDYLNKNLYQADSAVYALFINNEFMKQYQQYYIKRFKQFYEERLLNVDKNWQNSLDTQSSEFANLYNVRKDIINQRKNKKEAKTQATYCFSTNNLGFINIDKLLGEGQTEDVYVQATFKDISSVKNSMVYLVLKNNKSVISSSIENGMMNFAEGSQNISLPPNEEAFLVAISHKENNFFFFSQKINNKQKNNITINFEAKKLEDIKSFLEKELM